jgi:hypothetical protein
MAGSSLYAFRRNLLLTAADTINKDGVTIHDLQQQIREDLQACVQAGYRCRVENAEQTHSVRWMLDQLVRKCDEWSSIYQKQGDRLHAVERELAELKARTHSNEEPTQQI